MWNRMTLTENGVSGYVFGEAYALMLYECKVCGGREVLYNTRDGVTPFSIDCRHDACNQREVCPMMHIAWTGDKCLPDFKPWPGMRIFRDGTLEEARAIVRHRIDSCRGTPYECTPEKAQLLIASVSEDHGEFTRGWPMIEVVGQPAAGAEATRT